MMGEIRPLFDPEKWNDVTEVLRESTCGHSKHNGTQYQKLKYIHYIGGFLCSVLHKTNEMNVI